MLSSFQLYSKVIQLYLYICSFCNILFHYGYYGLLNIVPRAIHWMYGCSDSLQPHGLQPSRLLCPWDFPEKNTGVGTHFLLQGIFPTQGSNSNLQGFPHQQVDSLPPNHMGSLSWRVDSIKNQTSKIIFSNFTFSRYKLSSSFNTYSILGLRLPCSLQKISTQEYNIIPDFKHKTQRPDSWPSAI